MKKIYLAVLMLLIQFNVFSQTDIAIGSGGTTGNGNITYPCPLQDYYEGSRAQFLYLASELTAAGMGPGNISAIKFNVLNLNAFLGTAEQLTIKIGSTSTSSLTSNTWESGTTTVFGPINDTVTLGINTFSFTGPFFWNGSDNIVVEICNGDPNNATAGVTTYTENPTIPWTTGLSFNGSHTYRADNLGYLCGTGNTTNTGTQTTRPDITFSWAAASPTGCYLPSGTTLSNILSTTASATWNPPVVGATVTSYNWELRSSGAAGSGSTGLVASGNTATTTVNLTGLTPATTYYFYVKSDCGSGNISLWSAGYELITACAPIPSYSESFDAVTVPNLPLCWSKVLRLSGTSTANITTITGVNARSAPNAIAMANSSSPNTDDIILVSPPISNLSAGTYQLSFYAKNSVLGQDIEVGTLTDNTPTATFTSFQSVTVTTAYQKFSVSFAGYSGTDTYIGLRRLNANTFSTVYVDDIKWELIPTCIEPNTLLHTNITSTTAQLDWSPPSSSSPTSYDVYYSTSNVAPTASTTPIAAGITVTTYNYTSLIPSTKYFAWVRSNCGTGGVSQWSDVDSFLTACVGVPAFSENFNSVVTPALPLCWAKILRGTVGVPSITTVSGTNAYSAPNAISMYNSSSTSTADIILVSPPISNLSAGTYQLSFYAKNSVIGQNIEVGTLSDNSSTASFTPLQTVTVTTNYQKFIVSFAGYSGTDTYIGLRRLNATTFSYVYIDDVKWELIPSCVEPNTLVHTNITSTTAQLDWSPPSSSSPTSYDVYYSTSNVAPTGTTTPVAAGIAVTTYNYTGLVPSTKYFAWVRSNCGTGGVSQWSGADSFLTACVGVPAFSENFNSVVTPALPVCWSKILRGTVGVPSVTTVSGTNAYSAPNAISMYNSSSTSTADIILVSPPLSNLSVGTYQLSFYAKNSVIGQDIEVGTLSDNSSTASFTPLQTVTVTTSYQKFNVSFAGYSGTDTYIGLRRVNATTFSYVYIDDVNWELIPSCVEPNTLLHSNITLTSAQMDWTAPSSSTPASYEIYSSTSNTPPTSASTPTATGILTTTYNFTGLSSATKYFVWVRSNCGAGGTSIWSSPDSFFTPCNPTNIPYSQNFETASIPALPNCTSNENVGTGNNWITANNPGYGFTNKVLKYGYNGTNAADVWFYTQGLNLTGGTTYRLKFNYGTNSTFYKESLNVNYGTSPSSTDMANVIVDSPNITGGIKYLSTNDFTPSTTGTYYIGFHCYSIANQFDLYIDDISVDLAPLCVAPTALVTSNITISGAQIDWTAPSSSTPASYDLYSSTSNLPPSGTTTPTAVGITGTTYNLTSLSASTQYFVWVRSNCGTNGFSEWSVADSFYTTCTSSNLPYSQNFESATIPGLPACTGAENVGTGNIWKTSNAPGNGFNSKTMQYSYNATNAADTWFYTQGLNLNAGVTYRLKFYYGNNSTTYIEKLNVSYGSSPSASAMTNSLVDYPNITGAVKDTSITDFTPSATGIYYFGFHAYSDANQFNLYVDDILIDTASALPIKLVNFNGERVGSRNVLSWVTASEQNNKGYELQRSSNGEYFSTIGFVQSKAINGNSTSTIHYSYADEKPLTGNNYYRLKQVDFDGKYTFSNVVLIKGSKVNTILLSAIYPNPAKNQLNIVLTAPANDRVSLVITDLAGKVVMQNSIKVMNGDNNQVLNISGLSSGTYFVKAICDNGCETAVSRFVKQ